MVETGAIFNTLTFGNVNSGDYGIYITGEAVFNAPERAVDIVTIPGRNGAIAIDQGRWENIEVSYPAGTFGNDSADFASGISDFRNAILSQIGYQRLTDTYHPNEYRMAMYISGLEVDPVQHNSAGEFTLVFNCKPQRFLTAGESEQSITSGGTITNPTSYDASPLIKAEGYGTLTVGGKEIKIDNAVMGNVTIGRGGTRPQMLIPIDTNACNVGDTISVIAKFAMALAKANGYTFTGGTGAVYRTTSNYAFLSLAEQTFTFNVGTDDVFDAVATGTLTGTNGTSLTEGIQFRMYCTYISSDSVISISVVNDNTPNMYTVHDKSITASDVTADSTLPILGHPTYIDCDLGECYKVEGGTVVDLNRYIDLGSDLPVLEPGNNAITYDNTFTSVKVVPRWWQL